MPKITKYKHTSKYKAPKASIDEKESFSKKENPAKIKQDDRYSAKLVGLTATEGSFKKGGKVKNKFKDNPEDRFGKYRSTTAKKGKMIKADELDDELGSPPGAENYQKMYDQPESQGGDPKKRIMPKKKPKEFKKKDKPVTMILEKKSIEFIGKNKKS